MDERGSKGRIRRFLLNHAPRVQKPFSLETRKKLSESKKGPLNSQWNPIRNEVGRHGEGIYQLDRMEMLDEKCAICESTHRLELDHMIPIYAGGKRSPQNAQTLCRQCHIAKTVSERAYYRKLGKFSGPPKYPTVLDNTEPSPNGNVGEGATTRSRAVRRPRQKAKTVFLVCEYCGVLFERRMTLFRPKARAMFCGMSCRTSFFNSRRHGDKAPTKTRPERDEIVCSRRQLREGRIKSRPITFRQAAWTNYGGTITLYGDEIRQNMGDGKIEDLIKAKTSQAVLSGRDALEIDLWASTAASKKIQPLDVLVDTTSTVQNINSTTYSWWAAQSIASGSFAARGLADMRNLRDTIIRQGQMGAPAPDLVITTQLISELYEQSQATGIRYAAREEADGTFSGLKFSTAKMVFDTNCITGRLYMLSREALQLVVHSEAEWTIGEFKEPVDQDMRSAKVIWMGQLVVTNRRRLGRLTAVTA